MYIYAVFICALFTTSFVQLEVIKSKIQHRALQNIRRNRRMDEICYDKVGCFSVPHKRPRFTKLPESPEVIDTKFFLLRRDINFSHPQLLRYEDNGVSLSKSKFNPKDTVKVINHGYMGKWSDGGVLESVDAYLKIGNYNVLLTDWENGARSPQYATAAANTEIVGRQLGILLLHMINMGVKAKDIHLIGFSLGAHIAGCASELLKLSGHLLGRITGLDAASPLFRHNHMREKSKKLDKEDAILVDAIHTDASPFFAEGFGLLEPIGHVDFFPNGGFQQPGCTDSAASIVVSHFEGVISKEVACSHLRAWQLFLETLKNEAYHKNECKFTAYRCNGGWREYQRGECFAQINSNNSLSIDSSYRRDLGQFGETVKGDGVMYLTTRDSQPYCGTQLQSSVHISNNVTLAKGEVHINLKHDTGPSKFRMDINIDVTHQNSIINALSAVTFNSIKSTWDSILGNIMFISAENDIQNRTLPLQIHFDQIIVKDMHGNRWNFCKKATLIEHMVPLTLELRKNQC